MYKGSVELQHRLILCYSHLNLAISPLLRSPKQTLLMIFVRGFQRLSCSNYLILKTPLAATVLCLAISESDMTVLKIWLLGIRTSKFQI